MVFTRDHAAQFNQSPLSYQRFARNVRRLIAQRFVITSHAHRKEQRMSCIFHLALLAGVAFVAYHIGKEVGYEEAVSQRRVRHRHG